MPSSGLGAYQVKIHQIVFGGLFLAIVIMGGRSLAAGSAGDLKMLGVLSVITATVFALDRYYWVLCPFLLVIPITIPGLPFESSELGRLLLVGLFFVRAALRKESSEHFPKELFIAFPYVVWVAMIFTLNPSGLNILGSETIGARFYFKIFLGFFTMLTFSRLTISERDARYWVNLLIAASCVRLTMALSGFATIEVEENSTRYFLIPAATVLLLLLCRFDLRQIVSLSWRLPVSVFLALAVAYSGKRTSMGQVMLAPFILVFLRRRDKALLTVCACAGAIMLVFVISGHGRLYELPFSIQRSLSFLPGQWDQSLENYGTKDIFREQLQESAKEEIRMSPWIGNKGYSINRERIMWENTRFRGDQGGHSMAGNWHNKWYGIGADFGLPASMLWYFFAVFAAWYCTRNRWLFSKSGYRSTCFLYYSLYMFYDLIFAFGHSALTPYEQWTYFGFIVALVNSAKRERSPTLTGVSMNPIEG